jgi:hypothetical protein
VTGYRAGGRRRVDRVLDPALLEGLTSLAEDDLTARLEEAQAEENELSYVRRLLQGRLDILRAERDRRAAGEVPDAKAVHSDEDLVASLSRVLVDDTRGVSTATGPVEVVAPPMGQRRRAPERAIDDIHLSQPAGLDDDGLAEGMSRLQEIEAGVSRTRRELHRVLDAMTAEVERRISDGALVPDQPLP